MSDPAASGLLSAAEAGLARRALEAARRCEEAEPPPGDHEAEDAAARGALRAVSEAGLTQRLVPPEFRPGNDEEPVRARDICVIREEIAYVSGLADVMFVMQGLGSAAITLFGSGSIRKRYLPGVGAGSLIAGFALTEPEAGSDIASMATRAVREGGDYRITGVKTYISNAGLAGLYTLFARTGPEGSGKEGLSAFAVEADSPGLEVTRRLTVSVPHPIGTIELSGCRVPAGNRLGEEGEGYGMALKVLERFRPTVGAAACGFARRALDESLARARDRSQFGRPLSDHQAIRFKLADMAMSLDAARLLVMRAATLLDASPAGAEDPASRRASAMAKLFATEAAWRIVDEAVQIHGGLGVTRGQVVERLHREVRALRIYEGTSEIQRLVIAASLLKGASRSR